MEDISGLAAGSYSVVVTDANGCTATCSATVNEPTPIAIQINPSNVSCAGGNDGAIDITVSGGTPAYSYLWNNGATTEDLMNLSAGTYSVQVTDANGCTATTSSITINEPSALTANCSPTDVSCNGGSDGAVDLTVAGGTAPYLYAWSNGSTMEDISGLAAGTYSVVVTDANGCTATCSATVNEPTPIAIQINPSNVSCAGGNDGAIDITVSGGTPAYSYLWNNGATTEDLMNLSAGTYSVQVTDANGCTATTSSITINEPSALTANCSPTDVSCNGGSDGAVDLTVAGGTAPYLYAWSNGSTMEDISGLAAGTYSVVVTDANGCTATCSATVNEPTPIAIQINPSNVSCNGGNDGAIDITVSGGTPAYSYLWNNGATTEDLMNLSAGTYSVQVTDANGCTATTSSITINEPSALTANCSPTDVSCNGGSDGAVDLTAAGGTPPYTYAWNNGSTMQDISGLAAGSYSVVVTDANGCTATCSATVNEPTPIAIQINPSNVSCAGGIDGDIDITVSGGTPAYSYLWNNGATTEDLVNLSAGTYSVQVTDANGCTATTSSITITEPAAIAIQINPTNVSCHGGNDGAIDITVSGGTPAYSYLWNNGATTEDLMNIGAGTYSVVVTDANGCTATTSSITITQPGPISVTTQVTNVDCFGDATGSISTSVNGGTPPYSYTWSNGATTSGLTGIPAGTYTVNVSDANNCTSSGSSVSVTVMQPNSSVFASAVATDASCFGGSDGSVDATVGGGTPPYTYSWSNGSTTEDISGLSAGTYTLMVTDAKNCTAMTNATVGESSLLQASAVATDADCFGGNDGSVDLTVSGGTAPYSYNWSNGVSTEDLANLMAGSYSVVVTDANGCTATAAATVGEPSALSFTQSVIDATCADGADGSATVTPAGGTPPYAYLWSTGATTATASGLGKGTYPVTITDANGCDIMDTASIIIDAPDAIIMSITDSAKICLITTGLAPYPHGTIMNNQWNGVTISAVAGMGGANVVTVFNSDLTGTPDPDLEVGLGNLLTIPEDSIDANNDGLIDNPDDNQFGGLMIFEFDELVRVNDFTFVDQDINVLPTVTAYDSTGAIILQVLVPNMGDGSVQTVAMNVSGVAKLEIFSITSYAVTNFDIDCGVVQGGCINGSADLTVSGGTPPYMFLWSNGATTEDLTGVPCATYTVTVTDANNCTMTRSVTIDPNTAAISCTVTPQNVNACGGTGSATVSGVQGGQAPYTYVWNTWPQQWGATANGLQAGSYYVIITDANGCTAVETVLIEEDDEIEATASVQAASCWDANDGVFELNIYKGAGPFTYLWSDGATIATRDDLSRGTYTVTVTDINGCSRAFSNWINSPVQLRVGATTRKVVCEGDANGIFEVHVNYGTPPYTFLWNDGATAQNRYNLSKGVYTVTVTDANGCDKTIIRWIGQRYYVNVGTSVTNVSQVGASDGMAVAWG